MPYNRFPIQSADKLQINVFFVVSCRRKNLPNLFRTTEKKKCIKKCICSRMGKERGVRVYVRTFLLCCSKSSSMSMKKVWVWNITKNKYIYFYKIIFLHSHQRGTKAELVWHMNSMSIRWKDHKMNTYTWAYKYTKSL